MKKSLFLVALFIATITTTFAVNRLSNAVTGNWSSSSSWVGGIIPGVNDTAIIVNGAHITLNVANPQIFSLHINTGGIFSCSSNTLSLSGRFVTNGTFNANTGTILFNGFAFKQAILGNNVPTFNNVIINNTNTTIGFGVTAHPIETRFSGNIICNGVFNRNCTSTPNAYCRFIGNSVITGTNSLILHHAIIDAGATVNHQSPNIYVTGNWTNNGTFIPNTNTMNFQYSSCAANTQTVNNGTSNFYNVNINKPTTFTVTMANNTRVLNDFTNVAGVWSSQTFSLNVGGDFINTGTYRAGTGIVFLNGTSNQNINMGTSSLYNLRVNKSSGHVYALSNVNVTNFADLINGRFHTHANTIAPTVYELFIQNSNPTTSLTNYSINSFVIGRLRRQLLAGVNNYVFPIGPMNSPIKYRPITHQQTSSSGSTNMSMVADSISINAHKANWWVNIDCNAATPIGTLKFSYDLTNDFVAGMPECAIMVLRGTVPPPPNWTYVLNTTVAPNGGTNGTITTSIPTTLIPNAFILGEATPTIANKTICSERTVTLSITNPTGFVQFDWYNNASGGTAFLTNSTSYTTTLSNTTTYYIQTVAPACSGVRTPVTVSVIATPTVVISSASNNTICMGQSGTFVASGASGTNYSWSNGANNTTSITVSPTTNSTYTVLGTAANGCTNTAVVTVTVKPLPVLLSSINGSVCNGGSALMTANFTNGSVVNWFSDPSSTNILQNNSTTYNPNLTQGGTFTYYAQANLDGCLGAIVPVTATNFNVKAGIITSTNSGYSPLNVSFSSSSTGVTLTDSYYWTFGTNSSANSNNIMPSYVYTDEGVYDVVLTITDFETGCMDTAMVKIYVEDLLSVTIPNVFTPNGDGVNELFKAKIKGAKEAQGFIYDRWGLLLHSYDALNSAWDGKLSNGASVPDATYFYVMKVTDKFDEKTDYKGHLLLVR